MCVYTFLFCSSPPNKMVLDVYVRGADCISTDRAVQSLMSHGSPGFFVSDNLKCHEDTDCPPKCMSAVVIPYSKLTYSIDYCDHAEGVCIPEPHVEVWNLKLTRNDDSDDSDGQCHEDKDCAPGCTLAALWIVLCPANYTYPADYCDRAEGLCKRNKTPPKVWI